MRLARVISTYCIASLVLPINVFWLLLLCHVYCIAYVAEKDHTIVIELTLDLF